MSMLPARKVYGHVTGTITSIYIFSFVTYGHPEGSAAGDIAIITIIWNNVFK